MEVSSVQAPARITSYNVCYTKLLQLYWIKLTIDGELIESEIRYPSSQEETHPNTKFMCGIVGAGSVCAGQRNNFV